MAKAAKKKAAKKLTPKAADAVLGAKRARAYSDMEPHLCDLVSMGTIAMDQFDKDKGVRICGRQARGDAEGIPAALLPR
jgi:hypothetical protein